MKEFPKYVRLEDQLFELVVFKGQYFYQNKLNFEYKIKPAWFREYILAGITTQQGLHIDSYNKLLVGAVLIPISEEEYNK